MIKNRQLSFMSVCDIGESLITIDEFGRGIFRVDKTDMSSHLLAMLDCMRNQRNLYQSAEQFNNEIFFFPYFFMNDPIVVYHLLNRQVEYIDLGKSNCFAQEDYKTVKRVNNGVWLFPADIKKNLVIFHLDTRKLEVVPQWKEFMKNIVLNYSDVYRKIGKSVEIQDTLYYAVRKMNYVIATNKYTYESKCYILPSDKEVLPALDYDGQRLWFVEWNNKGVFSWEPFTGNVQEYPMTLSQNELQRDNWTKAVICGKTHLWLIPNSDRKVIKMNYETGKYECIDISCPDFVCSREMSGEEAFMTFVRRDNIMDIYPFRASRVIHIDLKNDILLDRYEQILLPAEWSDQNVVDYVLKNDNRYEPERVSKDIYMKSFFNKICKTDRDKISFSSGKNIWAHVSGE